MMGWGARRAVQSGAVAARGRTVSVGSSAAAWGGRSLSSRPQCARGRTVDWGLVRGWGTAGGGEIESAVGVGRKRGAVAYFNSLPFFCKSFMQSR